jgi:hypothetical protein
MGDRSIRGVCRANGWGLCAVAAVACPVPPSAEAAIAHMCGEVGLHASAPCRCIKYERRDVPLRNGKYITAEFD